MVSRALGTQVGGSIGAIHWLALCVNAALNIVGTSEAIQ
jgi:hypothetical protein